MELKYLLFGAKFKALVEAELSNAYEEQYDEGFQFYLGRQYFPSNATFLEVLKSSLRNKLSAEEAALYISSLSYGSCVNQERHFSKDRNRENHIKERIKILETNGKLSDFIKQEVEGILMRAEYSASKEAHTWDDMLDQLDEIETELKQNG
jgi:hypothetical protein